MAIALNEKLASGDTESFSISAARLGDSQFKSDYQLKFAYLAGAMYKGIASVELVGALAKAGLLGFFGTGGLTLGEIEAAMRRLQALVGPRGAYGMNLLCNLQRPEFELQTVQLFIAHGVRFVEAAAFLQMTPALVLY